MYSASPPPWATVVMTGGTRSGWSEVRSSSVTGVAHCRLALDIGIGAEGPERAEQRGADAAGPLGFALHRVPAQSSEGGPGERAHKRTERVPSVVGHQPIEQTERAEHGRPDVGIVLVPGAVG